jgi:hypothetical protein
VTGTAYQSSLAGTDNAFITKVAPGGSDLVFFHIFGGGQTDQANAIALDTAGNIYITALRNRTISPGWIHSKMSWAFRRWNLRVNESG